MYEMHLIKKVYWKQSLYHNKIKVKIIYILDFSKVEFDKISLNLFVVVKEEIKETNRV